MSPSRVCYSCFQKLEPNDKFCPKCGKDNEVKPSGLRLADGFINPGLLISEVREKVESLQVEVKSLKEEVNKINSKLDKILEKLEKCNE